MERTWTDPRDGKSWHIYRYNTAPAMAIDDKVPDAGGEEMIRFLYPTRHNPVEGHAIANPDLFDPNKMTDSEVQALLDKARKVS